MSSTLWVRCARPASVDALIATLELPALRLADGDPALWPDPALVYLPGMSARGIHLAHDGERLSIRLLAQSSPGDYELAFRTAERLSTDGLVDVEGHDQVSAATIRVDLEDWMIRDRAAGIVALQVALAAGMAVTITGPVVALEIAANTTTNLDKVWEMLRDATAREPESRDRFSAALAVVISGGRATAFTSNLGEKILGFLDGGPDAAEAAARQLAPVTATDYYTDAGWVLDRDRQRLLVQRRSGRMPDAERWSGYTITEHDRGHELAAYLGEHGLGLPAAHEEDPDPAWDSLAREIEHGETEHREWLAVQDRALPMAKSSGSLSLLLALPFLLALAIPALIVRLLTLPVRGAIRRHDERRRVRWRSDLRTRALAHTKTLALAPRDLVARHDRAVILVALGWYAGADRELSACFAKLEPGGAPARDKVLHNLSVSRHRLRFYRLSQRAADEAGYPHAGAVSQFASTIWPSRAGSPEFEPV